MDTFKFQQRQIGSYSKKNGQKQSLYLALALQIKLKRGMHVQGEEK